MARYHHPVCSSPRIVYQLATVDPSDHKPYVRSLIHRAFLAPSSPNAPLLLTTTDVRTPKNAQLANDSRVELAWWLPGPQAQLRVTGEAYVYPAPGFELNPSDAERLGLGASTKILKQVQALGEDFTKISDIVNLPKDFDWEKERLERFDAMSGHMRASWARPVPGTALWPGEDPKAWPETLPKLADAKDQERESVDAALNNFALVVINPQEVDYLELGVMPNRRTHFFKDITKGGAWDEEAVVP